MKFFIPLIFFISCSTLKKQPTQAISSLDQICLNSEGKGRVKRFEKQNLFSYESILKNKQWWMALDLPILGEELLGIDWSKTDAQFLGSFGQRLKAEIAESKDELTTLPWQKILGEIFLVITEKKYSEHIEIKNEGNELVIEGIDKKLNLEASMKFSDLSSSDASSFYQRVSLSIKKFGQFGPNSTLLGVDLFLNHCNKP